MAFFPSYPSMGMPAFGSPAFTQASSYGSMQMMPIYAPPPSYPSVYPPAFPSYPPSFPGAMPMHVYSQPAYQPYNTYGMYYPQQQFQPYGGFYLPWGMYGGFGSMGLPFDPNSFVLPNAISGYGAGAGGVSFPGIRFDQGEQLVSRLVGTYSKERMSLYQSMPARDGGRESAAELYRSADLARPSSIAPGSPPAQMPDEPAAAPSFLSSLLPASMRSTTTSTPAQEAPTPSLPPSRPKAASAAQQNRPLGGSVPGTTPTKAAPSPPPRTGSPASVSSVPLRGDAKRPGGVPPRPSSVTGVAPAGRKKPTEPPRQLCGVGLLFSREKADGAPSGGGWVVRKVVAGSPAGDSGLVQLGDVLTSVDGSPVGGLDSMFELSKRLLGAEGTSAALGFDRKGDAYNVELLRSNTFIGSEGGGGATVPSNVQEVETMEV